ncbi:MAG: hypothetical protein JNK74_09905 [Candidatus Hydrogenedentes bacterium]|nr:hypothetical protein [Candidatus Hydrogenedentota bacterium]
MRNPNPFDALKQHEVFSEGGSSGFRVSNPDNVVTNNAVADCQGFGYWLGFPATPWGPNHFVAMRPDRLPFGTFNDNSTHSTGAEGLMLDYVEVDNAGNVAPARYISTTDELDPEFPFDTIQRFDVSRVVIWKSGRGGLWDYSTWPNYSGIVSADNVGRFFAGAGEDGVIEHSLAIGDSLNSATPRPEPFVEPLGGTEIPTAFATFQGAFDIRENLVVNFPLVADVRSGVFATDDYYLHPVEMGLTRSTANFLLDSHPGYRSRAEQEHFALAGAVFDPEGLWGPAGQFIVYDEPFFTHGLPVSSIPPGEGTGGVSVPGPFYGIMNFVINNQSPPDHPLMALQATRLDPDSLAPIGTWTVNEAVEEWFLSPYRHFAAHGSGLYLIEFARSPMPTDLSLGFENMLKPEDTLVIGIQLSGAVTPEVYVEAYDRTRPYNALGSFQALRESSGETWWQDKPNNRVWVKLRGGFWEFWDNTGEHAVPTNDELLYEKTTLHLNTD